MVRAAGVDFPTVPVGVGLRLWLVLFTLSPFLFDKCFATNGCEGRRGVWLRFWLALALLLAGYRTSL